MILYSDLKYHQKDYSFYAVVVCEKDPKEQDYL